MPLADLSCWPHIANAMAITPHKAAEHAALAASLIDITQPGSGLLLECDEWRVLWYHYKKANFYRPLFAARVSDMSAKQAARGLWHHADINTGAKMPETWITAYKLLGPESTKRRRLAERSARAPISANAWVLCELADRQWVIGRAILDEDGDCAHVATPGAGKHEVRQALPILDERDAACSLLWSRGARFYPSYMAARGSLSMAAKKTQKRSKKQLTE